MTGGIWSWRALQEGKNRAVEHANIQDLRVEEAIPCPDMSMVCCQLLRFGCATVAEQRFERNLYGTLPRILSNFLV